MSKDYTFNPGDYVVYPVHGVGQVSGITSTVVGGQSLDLIAINFDKEKLTLKIPLQNTERTGLRALASKDVMELAEGILKSKSKANKRAQWTKRAQEYNLKINSGDPLAVAEVLRDLYKHPSKGEQTYSERQLYEQAMARFAPEFAAVHQLLEKDVVAKIETILYEKYV